MCQSTHCKFQSQPFSFSQYKCPWITGLHKSGTWWYIRELSRCSLVALSFWHSCSFDLSWSLVVSKKKASLNILHHTFYICTILHAPFAPLYIIQFTFAPDKCRPFNGFHNMEENNGMEDNIRWFHNPSKCHPMHIVQCTVYTIYTQIVYILCHNIYTIYIIYTQYTHNIYTIYIIYTQYTHNIHTIYTQYT